MHSLVDVLGSHARRSPLTVAYRFLRYDGQEGLDLSFAELDRRARAVASGLEAHGLRGKRVLLSLGAGADYVACLFGAFYAGSTVVPAYPPGRTRRRGGSDRVRAMLLDCGAEGIISSNGDWEQAAPDSVAQLNPATLLEAAADDWSGERPTAQDVAVLQYTSGSTSRPKGVMISHGNLVENLRMQVAGGRMTRDDCMVTWLPPFHDMGLVGGLFCTAFLGARCVVLTPEAFMRRPHRWLEAISQEGGTLSVGPNFALDLCVRRTDERRRATLDLSRLRMMSIGAEPIRVETLERFEQAFASCGFDRGAFYPCYGMAESTLIITGAHGPGTVVVRAFDADCLEQGRAEPTAAADRRLVGCGRTLLDEVLHVVDPDSQQSLGPGQVGEIWVRSRSVASGYWNRSDETRETFGAHLAGGAEGPFLRTGDLGFLDHDGELFVTGRLKDLIIIHGANHYPHDLEWTVQRVDESLVRDGGAAFSVTGSTGEAVVIVQELDRRSSPDPASLLTAIPQALQQEHGIPAHAVVLVRRGSILKTSSGKLRRKAIRAAYLEGTLDEVERWVAPAPAEPAAPLRPVPTGFKPTTGPGRDHVEAWLRERVASKIAMRPPELDPTAPLAQYGVDSLVVAELADELQQWLGVEIPTTLFYDSPTLEQLACALTAMGGQQCSGPTMLPPPPTSARTGEPVTSDPRQRTGDPIAIVGMSCRVPGAANVPAFWNLLQNGVDAITEVPGNRWDADALTDPTQQPGKMVSRHGGFLDGIAQFDAAFFGISPREADRMDPQQRIFLEAAWEALEDAAIRPTALAGTDTTVHAAVCSHDYGKLLATDLTLVDGDYGTGNAASIVANRLSYFLDLKGLSTSVDAACASSLVALQGACRTLETLDCDVALVGAVNAILSPETSVFFSRARALAADGRCKAFDAEADGLSRGEAAVVLVLKRLSQARKDGDRILALVEGVGVNHDGRSNGLMAPNPQMQQRVLEQALHRAGISPDELDYVEAHGVGTPVSDAVEMRALGRVLGERSAQAPCLVGSVKTNVGHTEAAAGLVGVVKTVLALQHEEIPPHLHLNHVHKDIDLANLPIEFPTVPCAWPRGERPRFAAVSAYGFGGTNAAVVLREAPLQGARGQLQGPQPLLVPLSARSDAELRRLARRMSASLPKVRPSDAALTLARGRERFEHRLCLLAEDAPSAAKALQQFADGLQQDALVEGRAPKGANRPLTVVLSEGVPAAAQRRALLRGWPELQPRLRHATDAMGKTLGTQLGTELMDQARPSDVEALAFAWHYGLWPLLERWGVVPDRIVGAGVGELSAACASGMLDWETGLRLVAARTQARGELQADRQPPQPSGDYDALLSSCRVGPARIPVTLLSGDLRAEPDRPADSGHWSQHLYAPSPPPGRLRLTLEAQDGASPPLALWLGANPSPCAQDVTLPDPSVPADHGVVSALARLFVQGAPVSLEVLLEGVDAQPIALPSYPFDRQHHWLEAAPPASALASDKQSSRPSSHPFISRVVSSAPRAHSGFVRRGKQDEVG